MAPAVQTHGTGARLGAAGVVLTAHGLAAMSLLALSPSAPVAEAPRVLQVAWIGETPLPTPTHPLATPQQPSRAPLRPTAPTHQPAPRLPAAPLQSTHTASTHEAPPTANTPPVAPPADSTPDGRPHESAAREAAAPSPRPTPPTPGSPPRFDADYLSNPAPDYPAASRQLREQGSVQLRVFVTADGRAGEVRVHQGSGFERLDQAAIDAVRRWRFVPARQGDGPVAAWVIVPINFTLRRS